MWGAAYCVGVDGLKISGSSQACCGFASSRKREIAMVKTPFCIAVEPLNKGPFGANSFVPCREVLRISEGPLSEVPLYYIITVQLIPFEVQ